MQDLSQIYHNRIRRSGTSRAAASGGKRWIRLIGQSHGGHLTVQWCRAVSCSLTCPVAVQFWFGDSLSQNIRCLIDIRLPLSVARPLSRNVAAQKKFWTLSTILLQLVWLSMGQRASRESLYCRLTLYIVPKHGHGALMPHLSHFKLARSDFQSRVCDSNHLATHFVWKL